MLDTQKLDLRKQIVLDISKKKGIENQKAQVMVCMDISGSMEHLYNNGFVQRVLERIIPVAMQFDDNGEMELYLFENSCRKHKNSITLNNIDGIVTREIIGKYPFGGTSYAPPIQMIKEDVVGETKSSTSFSFFGSKRTIDPKKLDIPAYVIFITDGANSDHGATESILKEVSNYGLFFQFVGIGSASFPFLEKLDNLAGRLIDNANFFKVTSLDAMSDDDLYNKLLGEFPDWLKLARTNNLIA